MYLYHYFEKSKGPFLSITELPLDKAVDTLNEIKNRNQNLVNPNIDWFLKSRYEMEQKVREQFVAIGGKPERKSPVYMTLGEHLQFMTWYDNPACIKIPVAEFDRKTVSYTYGDVFAVFNDELNDGREFWNTVYMLDDIVEIVKKYGNPPYVEYNVRERIYPKETPINHLLKYVEAHVWSDDVIGKYRKEWESAQV